MSHDEKIRTVFIVQEGCDALLVELPNGTREWVPRCLIKKAYDGERIPEWVFKTCPYWRATFAMPGWRKQS